MKDVKIINLQLFANHVNVTTDNALGNDLSVEMKTFYDMTLIDEASANLVHDQFGQKRPIPKNGGKTIEFRKFSPLPKALTALTEGVTPDGKTLNASNITATVSQYGDYVTQSDVLELTALDNTILESTKLLGKQAGLTLDTVVRNILVAGNNVSYCPTKSGSTETPVTSRSALNASAVLTVKQVQKIVAKLRGQNAPTIKGEYVAIIHPYAAFDLTQDEAWVEAHKYAQPNNIFEGEIGKISGVRFVQSTEAKVIAPGEIAGGKNILTCKTAINSSTSSVVINESLSSTSGLSVPVYVNGVANTVTAVTSNAGTTTLTLATAISSLAAGDIICGQGAANDGSSVFCTMFLGEGAYGVTEITGGGLETIVKQKGSAGTADPLNQRSSIGWKAMKTAEILIPSYMVRVESCSPDFAFTPAN